MLLVWPWPLYVDRDFSLARGANDPLVILGFVLLAAYVTALAATARRAPIAAFALVWYGLNLLVMVAGWLVTMIGLTLFLS